MNPENCGAHITNHHSYLWRKPMFIEPKAPSSPCHGQLNSYSSTETWRNRNNSVHTNYGHLSRKIILKNQRSALDDVLQDRKENSEVKRTMIKSLMAEKKDLEKSEMLVEGMKKLKELDLLSGKGLKKVSMPGIIRHEHVHNDYHERSTNPGYSRNYQGKFFTK